MTQAMADFGVIVQSLHKARKLGNVQSFSDLAMPIIFQNWADLMRWLTYMLSQVSLDSRSNVATLCCELLRGATAGADHDPYREELAMRDCTIDLIFLLLCQTDDAGSYLYVPPRADRSCAILSLFREYFQVPSMREALDERLHCRRQHIRKAILKSLVGRARTCVERGTSRATIVGSIKSLSCILEGIDQFTSDPALWRILYRQDFLREFTAALLALVEHGTSWNMSQDQFVWRSVANSFYVVCHSTMFSPRSPRESVLKLVNAGLISCAQICLSRILDAHSVHAKRFRTVLLNIIPYLYTPRVQDAMHATFSPYDIHLPPTHSTYDWQGCEDVVRWGKTLRYVELRRRDPIALCTNLHVSHFVSRH